MVISTYVRLLRSSSTIIIRVIAEWNMRMGARNSETTVPLKIVPSGAQTHLGRVGV